VVRATRALAALEGSAAVEESHVDVVLPLALAHRAPARGGSPRREPPAPQPGGPPDEAGAAPTGAAERVFAPLDLAAPRLVSAHRAEAAGTSGKLPGGNRGSITGARRTAEPGELDPRT